MKKDVNTRRQRSLEADSGAVFHVIQFLKLDSDNITFKIGTVFSLAFIYLKSKVKGEEAGGWKLIS